MSLFNPGQPQAQGHGCNRCEGGVTASVRERLALRAFLLRGEGSVLEYRRCLADLLREHNGYTFKHIAFL